MTQGYYWAFRKGSPDPEVVYVYNGKAYSIWLSFNDPNSLYLEGEPLSEGKWVLGEKVHYDRP